MCEIIEYGGGLIYTNKGKFICGTFMLFTFILLFLFMSYLSIPLIILALCIIILPFKSRITLNKVPKVNKKSHQYKCKSLKPIKYNIGDLCHLGHKINEDCCNIDNNSCKDYCYSGAMG